MDTAQWPHQEMVVKPTDEVMRKVPIIPKKGVRATSSSEKELEALNCPRCNSINTKFCYYNNYSLTQPRYFCKTCRRYWTQGGSLRNIPVGGGSRKNNNNNNKTTSKLAIPPEIEINTTIHHHHQTQDLNLATFPANFTNLSQLLHQNNNNNPVSISSPSTTVSSSHLSALGVMNLNNDNHNNANFNMSLPDPNTSVNNNYSSTSGFPPLQLQDFKPNTLNFSLDLDGISSSAYPVSSGRILFPFQDLKQVSTNINNNNNNTTMDQKEHQGGDNGDSNGYWTAGMLPGGSW